MSLIQVPVIHRPELRSERALAAPNRNITALCLIIGVAFILRMVVVSFVFRSLPDASRDFEQFGWETGWVARALAAGHGFSSPFFPLSGPTALVPPLYTALLAAIFHVFGIYSLTSGVVILSLNSLFSAVTCIPVYFSAKHSLGLRAAKISAWGWAFYPFAIYFSAGRVWEYALTSLLFTTCFCIAQRLYVMEKPAHWFGFGCLYGVTALCNPSVVSAFPFLVLIALWQSGSTNRRSLIKAAAAMLGLLVLIGPWTIRNYRALHVLCPVRDNYALEFWAGNNGDTSDPNPAWAHPASNPAEMQLFLKQGEAAYIAQKHLMAAAFVLHHVRFFLGLSARRLVYYWTGFWSTTKEYRRREPFQLPNVFFCTAITIFMLRGARNLSRQNPILGLPYLVLIVIFPLTYYFTHPAMDYRQPIEPAIIVLVVCSLVGRKASDTENLPTSGELDLEYTQPA